MSRVFGLAAAALLSLAGTDGALAADPAMKAPASLVSGCGWCGFYVGGNAGYAWGRDSQTSVFTAPAPAVAGITYNTTARLTANIARVGVNYHFGAPAVAKY
jgi:opacity protein-like surface antigen